jgi:hypothetical protein
VAVVSCVVVGRDFVIHLFGRLLALYEGMCFRQSTAELLSLGQRCGKRIMHFYTMILGRLKQYASNMQRDELFYNFSESVINNAPRRYPYFDVVVGLVWSHDPKSYAGGSVWYW